MRKEKLILIVERSDVVYALHTDFSVSSRKVCWWFEAGSQIQWNGCETFFSILMWLADGQVGLIPLAVLKAYELVPEAYCQWFRSWEEVINLIWSLLVILPLNLIIGVLQLRLILMRLSVTQFWSNLKILYWSELQPSEQTGKTTAETFAFAHNYVLMQCGKTDWAGAKKWT